jgi:FG-GAP repeat
VVELPWLRRPVTRSRLLALRRRLTFQGASKELVTGEISIYLGGPDGFSADRRVIAEGGADSDMPGGPGADLNGDGYTDFATAHVLVNEDDGNWPPDVGLVQFGQVGGLSQIAASVTIFSSGNSLPIGWPIGVGDIDGDGFADLLWPVRYGGFVFRGCLGGPAPDAWAYVGCGNCQLTVATVGDIDGDGVFDLAYADSTELTVYRGGPMPWLGSRIDGAIGGFLLDANYDGYSDLLTNLPVDDWAAPHLFPGGPDGLSASPVGAPLLIAPVAVGDFDGDGLWDGVTYEPTCQGSCVVSYLLPTVHYGAPGPWGASFARVDALPVPGYVTVVDMNADGYDDLLVVGRQDGSVQLWTGSPAGLQAPAP